MGFKFVFLWTDVVLWAMLLLLVWYVWRVRKSPNLRATWDKVLRDPAALCAALVMIGINALRSTWRPSTRNSLKPLARAVRT